MALQAGWRYVNRNRVASLGATELGVTLPLTLPRATAAPGNVVFGASSQPDTLLHLGALYVPPLDGVTSIWLRGRMTLDAADTWRITLAAIPLDGTQPTTTGEHFTADVSGGTAGTFKFMLSRNASTGITSVAGAATSMSRIGPWGAGFIMYAQRTVAVSAVDATLTELALELGNG